MQASPAGKIPSSEPRLIHVYVATWRHWAMISLWNWPTVWIRSIAIDAAFFRHIIWHRGSCPKLVGLWLFAGRHEAIVWLYVAVFVNYVLTDTGLCHFEIRIPKSAFENAVCKIWTITFRHYVLIRIKTASEKGEHATRLHWGLWTT